MSITKAQLEVMFNNIGHGLLDNVGDILVQISPPAIEIVDQAVVQY